MTQLNHLDGIDLIAAILDEDKVILKKIQETIFKIHHKGYKFSRITFVDGKSIFSGFAFVKHPHLCHTFSYPKVLEISDAFLFYHNLDESPEAPDDLEPHEEVACTDSQARIDDFIWIIEESNYTLLSTILNRLDHILSRAGCKVSMADRTSGIADSS
jgi:hypothetical protein